MASVKSKTRRILAERRFDDILSMKAKKTDVRMPSVGIIEEEGKADIVFMYPVSGQIIETSFKITFVVEGASVSGITKEYKVGETIVYPTVSDFGYDPEKYKIEWVSAPEKMPAQDITVNGNAIYIAPLMCYFGDADINEFEGALNTLDFTSISEKTESISLKEIIEISKTSGKICRFNCLINDENLEMMEKFDNGEITDEEFDEYLMSVSHYHVIMVPVGYNIDCKCQGLDFFYEESIVDYATTINGCDYNVYLLKRYVDNVLTAYNNFYYNSDPMSKVPDNLDYVLKITE